jgi:histidyl-tRNA synthetase
VSASNSPLLEIASRRGSLLLVIVAANLSHADRTRIAHVAILGAAERAAGVVAWRTLATRAEERLPLPELLARQAGADSESTTENTEDTETKA